MNRVALLTPYALPVRGGISTFVDGLANALVTRGAEVSVVAGAGSGSRPGAGNLGAGGSFVRKAVTELRRMRPEVVHAQAHWYCLQAGLIYARARQGVRVVFSFHTTTVPIRKWRFMRLLAQADVITFVSVAQLAELRDRLRLAGDLRLLRPATEVPPITDEARAAWTSEYDLRGRFPVLTFAGPLEHDRKVAGVVDLVQAMKRVVKEFPTAQLLILGDGSKRARVAIASRGVEGAVRIVGFVDRPTVGLAACDLYCHISYQEGLPLALLEAMAVGTCCLATRTGGIPEVITGENGFLVDAGPENIASRVIELAGDGEKRRVAGEAGKATITASHTWQSRIDAVADIYGWGGP